MADFSRLVQKAFYLGVGIAAYAGEKASDTFADLRGQAQKLVDELVERGELTAEEAQKMVDDMVNRAQAAAPETTTEGPRRIEILEDSDEQPSADPQAEAMRRQVEALREELRRLKDE
ncbi:MAG: hypothetical protein AAFQ61_06690 [Cyanobacteria bacterium J06626_23]